MKRHNKVVRDGNAVTIEVRPPLQRSRDRQGDIGRSSEEQNT
jgi:hypothetical protein